MKTAVFLVLLALLCSGVASGAQWIALWTEDDAFYGMRDDGQVWCYNPGIGTPASIGSFGAGPWVGFSKNPAREFLALKATGEIYAMTAFGSTRLLVTLPGSKEWCALLTTPETGYGPSYALTCDGEIWVLSDPPALAGRLGNPPVPLNAPSWGKVKTTFRASVGKDGR